MGLIKSKLHSIIDYVLGVLFLICPFILGFSPEGREAWLMFAAGILIISYSLFTDYEVSLKKIIPLQAHLAFDGFIGIFLAFSPWMFGFSENMYLMHVILGGALAFFSIFTIVPEEKKTPGKYHIHHLHHPIKRLVHGRRRRQAHH